MSVREKVWESHCDQWPALVNLGFSTKRVSNNFAQPLSVLFCSRAWRGEGTRDSDAAVQFDLVVSLHHQCQPGKWSPLLRLDGRLAMDVALLARLLQSLYKTRIIGRFPK